MVAESDPESAKIIQEITGQTPAEIAQEIREDYASGRIRDQPWRWDQCHSWLDGWLYIYRRTYLDYHAHLLWEDERVKCAVQIGPDFNDKTVVLLERLAGRLGPCSDLQELRLIETKVIDEGLARLQRVVPNAKTTRYSREDWDANPDLGYAKG